MRNLEGQRIVITGATGFIGRNVAEQLLAQGARVFALVRPESRQRRSLPVHEHLTWIEATMEEAESCAPLIGHADGFLHFAWGGVNREEIDSPEVQASNVDHGGSYGVPSGQCLWKSQAGICQKGRGILQSEPDDLLSSAVFQCLRNRGSSLVDYFHVGERASPKP